MARRCSSNRSRKPSVVIRPTRAPRRSIRAFVATVLLWVWNASRQAGWSGRNTARISSTPVRMLSPGCDGVLGTLKQCTSPAWVTNTRSVKVPPTSVPIEHCKLMCPFAVWRYQDRIGQNGCRPEPRSRGLPLKPHQGALPLGTPPRAEPLEPFTWRGWTGGGPDCDCVRCRRFPEPWPGRRRENAKIARETMRYRPQSGNIRQQ